MLAWDMGTGKTFTALDAWMRSSALDKPLLILCLASARENWKREALRICPSGTNIQVLQTTRDIPHPDAHVVITNYDKLDRRQFKSGLLSRQWGALVLDEAHLLKNINAKRTIAVYGGVGGGPGAHARIPLIDRCNFIWPLTGTPTPNHPGEIYSHARALWPDRIKYRDHVMEEWEFQAQYCQVEQTKFGLKIVGATNMAELHDRLDPVVNRLRRTDVLDLPPIRIDSWPLDGETTSGVALRQREEEQALFGHLIDSYGDITNIDNLDFSVIENYLTCINSNSTLLSRLRQEVSVLKAGATAAMLGEEREAGGCGKTVVFAHHREAIEILSKHLSRYGVATIHGGVPAKDRQAVIDRFNRDPTVNFFVGQLTAAGSSINLQDACSSVVFVEGSWTPGDNEQAIARVYRRGQLNPVLVRYVYLPGSVDEAVNRALARKMAMQLWT
jgi:SWI/SNF-related matrix-associated actin-dependent regulator of chromatin subfamily A-like protein 1